MKKLFTAILLGFISIANAQVIIGDATGTAAVKTSVLLEFAANQNKGIIVPYVTPSLPASPSEGTILVDATTPTNSRVKYYAGTVKGWVDLSGQPADLTSTLTTQPTGITEATTSKAIIGAATSAADGVLVLESTTKAMVLPIVEDVQNIPNPAPGMIVDVKKAGAKRLAVYNGSKWSFWMP